MINGGEHFVTCGQMKILERRADENGLSYYEMMENAGTGAASIIMDSAQEYAAKDNNAKKVYIFCGKGNNGGDGFVTARIMDDKGYQVTVVLVEGEPRTEDAIKNYRLVSDRNIAILDLTWDEGSLLKLKGAPDILVDAVYGTGFRGKLQGNGLKAAIYINRYSAEGGHDSTPVVVALDIPSGVGGDVLDENAVDPNSVCAHHTITFHAKKPVHLQPFAAKYCGRITVVDIGIDEDKLWSV